MLRTFRTASFRLSVLFAGLFALCFTILMSITYFATTTAMHDQLRRSIEDESAALVADAANESASAIADDVNERLQTSPGANKYYYFRDASGRKLAGNLGQPVGLEGWHEGPFSRTLVADAGLSMDQDHELWGRGTTLPGGSFIFIGQDAYQVISTQEIILQTLIWSAIAAFIIAIVAGIFASQRFLGRIDAINTTSQAIMNGRLKERIPIKGALDEMDRLSANLNRLFDGNQALLESLTQVTTNIAHDLRSPLSRLRQALDSARVEGKPRKIYLAAIETAIDEADTLLATFSGLLRIAQIESGSPKSGFQLVYFSEIAERVARAYQPVAEDMDKTLTTLIEPELEITGDRDLLTQMLANLIENAIHHTPAQTRIHLKLERDRHEIVAMVSDSGPGIPPEERQKVFERFYRLDASRTAPGSGLGLSLVAAVASLHDIRIELSDNHPGLRAVMRIPVLPQAATAPTRCQPIPAERISLVSDI
jgi:signal transduction histidine kinase